MEKLQGINVIEFSGEGCANCFSLMPLLHSLLKDYPDVNLKHVEVDETTMEIVKKFDVERVPTVIVTKDENEISRCRGFQPEEILALWLESKINDARKL